MELMEDGNLMDKVHILIQRDFEYYTNNQSILQETICAGIVGGKLDFPRSASFASVKLVLWWEDEFIAAYRKHSGFLQEATDEMDLQESSGGCGGVVKASDPMKFSSLVTKSSDLMLEHLHVLTQEALDHADLSVLTGTIGAAALLKNCLWCYLQRANENSKDSFIEEMQKYQKKYQEMVEALAERLLDLHCRLLSLYILQDADSLDWENMKPFCESERGSYVIQMWWLYMQGVKEDLWNTVPPQMAQRVFAGMLNESLTILAVRYGQAIPSKNRTQLYAVDLSNLLLGITELLPTVCETADEFTGVKYHNKNKLLRDVHSKCQELLTCLITRGCDLEILHKVFKKNLSQIGIFKPRLCKSPSPWLYLTIPYLHPGVEFSSITIELLVLLAQPQPNWASLLKIVVMDNFLVAKIILQCASDKLSSEKEMKFSESSLREKCGRFLCSADGSCKGVDISGKLLNSRHFYNLVYAVNYVVLTLGDEATFKEILIDAFIREEGWTKHFDRRQVWNLKRPAWYESFVALTRPALKPIREILINAVKTGASVYQSCAIVLVAFAQLWDTMHPSLYIVSTLIQDILPTSVVPLGNSVLLQILISSLYSELVQNTHVTFAEDSHSEEVFEGVTSSANEIALAVAESLCSIDEDNKHTDEIQQLVECAKRTFMDLGPLVKNGGRNIEENNFEYLVSLLLLTNEGKRALKIIHHFIKNNDDWLLEMIRWGQHSGQYEFKVEKPKTDLMQLMFFMGSKPFDELLSGNWKPNWLEIFHIPMGLSTERISDLVFSRWDLKDGLNGQILLDIQSVLRQ